MGVCPSNRPQLTGSPRMPRDRIDRRSLHTAFHGKNRKRVPAVDTSLMGQDFTTPIRGDFRGPIGKGSSAISARIAGDRLVGTHSQIWICPRRSVIVASAWASITAGSANNPRQLPE